MKLTTLDVAGKSYDVEVDLNGYFRAEVAGASVGSSTLEGLTKIVRKRASAARVRISISYTDPADLHPCIVTGKHATTGMWLVKDTVTGKTEQFDCLPYVALRPLDSAEIDELKLLKASLQQASRNLDAATTKYRITPNLRDQAEAALLNADLTL